MKGVVLGGTRSNVGKTVAALATMRALMDAGYDVQPAKAGPDFIDPSHHSFVADAPSRTLDCWLQGTEGLRRNYHRGTGDICVVEGVMGLYDGDGSSTAMVAEALDLPVILVVDASAGMESVAATALGFREFASNASRDIDVAGVLVQRAHGGRHATGIREALPEELTYFGRIPPRDSLEIPERHLGLHMGRESPLSSDALASAAEHIETEKIVAVAREPPKVSGSELESGTADSGGEGSSSESKPHIAVASDAAFCFVYPGTMERLRETATVTIFSPVAGDALPATDGIYLPGGYPELHGAALADSQTLESIADRAAAGVPVLGECGGFMALAESLATTDGERHAMAGVLPADVEMHERYQALDHTELVGESTAPFPVAGRTFRGHEFHYSSATTDSDARFAFSVTRGEGIDGSHDGIYEYRTVGTYAHHHAESGLFDAFLDAAVANG